MPKLPATGYVLAFDFGLKHIGVATGQTITDTATPLMTLRATGGVPDWNEVARLLDEWRPQCLVVGLPLNMDDTESTMSAAARVFAKHLGKHADAPVHLHDERLTSRAVATENADRSPPSHARAAVLIAQSWLAEQRRRSRD